MKRTGKWSVTPAAKLPSKLWLIYNQTWDESKKNKYSHVVASKRFPSFSLKSLVLAEIPDPRAIPQSFCAWIHCLLLHWWVCHYGSRCCGSRSRFLPRTGVESVWRYVPLTCGWAKVVALFWSHLHLGIINKRGEAGFVRQSFIAASSIFIVH